MPVTFLTDADKQEINKKIESIVTVISLKGSAIGNSVTLDDVSPIEHTMDVKVKTKNIIPIDTNKFSIQQATKISGDNNGIIAKGVEGNIAYAHSSGWIYFYQPNKYADIVFVKDVVTVSIEVTLIEEGKHGATFKIGPTEITGGTIFTATTTPTRFSFTCPVSAIPSNGFYICINANTLKIANVQFEYGEVATEYTPYMTDVSDIAVEVSDENGRIEEFQSNADGTVEGVRSSYPSMTLTALNTGAVVDVSYNRDINKAFTELEEKLVSITTNLTNAIISTGGNV